MGKWGVRKKPDGGIGEIAKPESSPAKLPADLTDMERAVAEAKAAQNLGLAGTVSVENHEPSPDAIDEALRGV